MEGATMTGCMPHIDLEPDVQLHHFDHLSCLLQGLCDIISKALLLFLQALPALKPDKILYLQISAHLFACLLQHLMNLLCIVFHIPLIKQAALLVELHWAKHPSEAFLYPSI